MEEYRNIVVAEDAYQNGQTSASGKRKWTPINGDLVLWYDWRQKSSVSSTDGDVSQWRDIGPLKQHLNTLRPEKMKFGPKGLTGDGQAAYMTSSLNFDWAAESFAVVIAATVIEHSPILTIRLRDIPGDAPTWFGISSIAVQLKDNTNIDLFSYDAPLHRPCIYTLIKTPTGVIVKLNGGVVGSNNMTSIGGFNNRLAVGIWCCPTVNPQGVSFTTGQLVGSIHEIVLQKTVDAEKVEGYLSHKWGVPLPTDHTYHGRVPNAIGV